MDAIEKRARELDRLASLVRDSAESYISLRQSGQDCDWKEPYSGYWDEQFGIGAHLLRESIANLCSVAALTPPEGYVLVPVEPTEAMVEASYGHYGPGAYEAMLAARPEVP